MYPAAGSYVNWPRFAPEVTIVTAPCVGWVKEAIVNDDLDIPTLHAYVVICKAA